MLGCLAVTGVVTADVEPAALVPAGQQLPVTQETQLNVIPQDSGLVTTNTGLDLDKAQNAEIVALPESTQPIEIVSEDKSVTAVERPGTEAVVYEQVALSVSEEMGGIAASDMRTRPLAPGAPSGSGGTFGALGGSANDQPSLPYALVLALIALIGLVPVSRRYH